MNNPIAVYVHIPFCKSKCSYCDFVSFPNAWYDHERYKNILISEIKNCSELKSSSITSIFIGGGTPTVLPPSFLCEILSELFKYNVSNDAEITVEANPESLTAEMAASLKKAGINRLSFGLQAWQDTHLKQLGRVHDAKTFLHAYNTALQCGFSNINVDLMFSLPNQTVAEWRETLENIIALEPTHVSTYSLILEEGTPLFEHHKSGKLALPTDEADREMYYLANDLLSASGYSRYEISNFAKNGLVCKHNEVYWRRGNYLGLGLNSHSLVDGVRFNNCCEMEKYLLSNGDTRLIREGFIELSEADCISEFMFLGLRMTDGVSMSEFERFFGKPLEVVFSKQVHSLLEGGLIEMCYGNLRLTEKGADLANVVMAEFLL